jgi:biotin carboxyl carrier protein
MDTFKILINEHQIDLNEDDLTESSSSNSAASNEHTIKANEPRLLISEPFKKRFLIAYRGHIYRVTIQDKNDLLIDQMGYTQTQGTKSEHIKAPMPGLVLEIKVKSGDQVKQGDSLIVLEAMKMENVLKAHHDGAVRVVNVEKGQAVDKGQVLIEIE